MKDKHDEHVDKLVGNLDAIKARLRALGEAEEHVWESLKIGVEHTRGTLQSALQDTVENLNTGPPIAGPHGSDEGAYLYGECLKRRSTEKVI